MSFVGEGESSMNALPWDGGVRLVLRTVGPLEMRINGVNRVTCRFSGGCKGLKVGRRWQGECLQLGR